MFLFYSFVLLLFSHVFAVTTVVNETAEIYDGIEKFQDYYELPKLPYSYDALEPWIDAKTMEAHHAGHLASYTAKMNAALEEWRKSGEENDLAMSSLVKILQNVDKIPAKWKKVIQDNAGGYTNHIFYFSNLFPNPKEIDQPMPFSLLKVFRRSFHNFTSLRVWMSSDALSLFGSGYVWLCRVPKQNYLTVYSTTNQISPLTLGLQPLLVIDVWEHAYYLKHQYRRKDYINDWWNVISWMKVEQLFDWWMSFEPKHDEL